MDLYNIKGLVLQLTDWINEGKISKDEAVSAVGNVVDLDKLEASNEIESYVYQWIDKL